MRLLALDQYSDLGGAQLCLAALTPYWVARGWQVTVAAPGGGALASRVTDSGASYEEIPLERFSAGRKRLREAPRFAANTAKLALELRRRIARLTPDAVYVNGPRLLPAVALAAPVRLPLVFHCHSAIPQRSAARAARLALSARRWTTLACSEYAYRTLQGATTEWRLIYNGVEAGPERKDPAAKQPAFGVIGRIAPEKGQLAFVHAALLVAAHHPKNCRFLLCGEALFDDPAAREYAREVERLAGDRVERLGWRDDVAHVLDGLDWLVIPSLAEPATTRVILEAYARGVPVIAFSSGGIPEVVVDGETGLLVDVHVASALAETMTAALRMPETLRRRMGEAGYTLWGGRFRLERFQREVTEAIEEAVRA